MPVMHGREDTEKWSSCGQLMEHLVCSAAIIIVRGPLVCQMFHVAQFSRWVRVIPLMVLFYWRP